jgi:hypothetical protein
MLVEARDIKPGDLVDGIPVTEVLTTEIIQQRTGPATKTLVTLDSEGYAWQKCYNPTDPVWVERVGEPLPRLPLLDIAPQTEIAGRLLVDYVELHAHRNSAHSTDDIVGYVVRETIRQGRTLNSSQHGGCGYDVQAVVGGYNYAATFGLRDKLREGRGYAVVDSLYSCGCRSGLPIPQPHVAD